MRSAKAIVSAAILCAGFLTVAATSSAGASAPIQSATLTVAVPTSAASSATAPAAQSVSTPVPQHFLTQPLCAIPGPGQRGCFALKMVPTGLTPAAFAAAAATPSGYGPADLNSAYNMPSSGGSGVTVAIVDAYNDPTAESDLSFYRSQYGLPICTTANGCFSKVSQTGSTSSLPTTDTGWSGEIALDIEMVSAGCPNCHILLVEANSANNADLDIAVNYAAAHAQVVSNSYGGSEYSSETSDSAYSHPGVSILASSGDSGYSVEFPAAAPSVIAVGGTKLSRATGTRGWTEAAWNTSETEGAGSGCSAYETKPTWQQDTGCANRTVADVSAVADPATGVAVYDTTGGTGWAVYGGTSVSSPLVAAILSTTGHAGITASYLYAHPNFLYDVTSGQTSIICSSYLCKSGPGYDGPTGLGTPNGALLAGSTTPPSDFAVAISPTSGTEAAGSSTTATVSTSTIGSAQTVTLSVSGLPAGVTGIFSPTAVTSGASSTLTLSSTSSAAAATSPLTITGSATSGTHSAAYSLTVTRQTAANDFSLAASSASVTAGSSGTSTISTATTAGTAQTVSLVASGAPAGMTVTLNPTSVSSGANSTATIAVPAGTAAGSYSITITGTASSGSHTATIALTVKAASTCVAGQKLLNPGFESGTSSWASTAGVIATDGAHSHTGSGYAWLDGYGTAHTDTISQSVTVPTGCNSVVLSFWLNVNTSETTTTTAYDKLTVSAGTTTLATYSNLTPAGYAQHFVTLTGTAGQSVTVTFKGVEDSSLQTSFFIDDTALTVS